MTKRACHSLLLLMLAASSVFASDEHDAWIEALTSESFADREAALVKLREAGLDARDALLRAQKHESREIRARVARLLEELGILTDEQEAVYAAEVKVLFTTTDLARRAEAVQSIFGLGSVAVARLRRVVLAGRDEIQVEATMGDRPWIERNEEGKARAPNRCRIRVSNVSERPLLLPKNPIVSSSRSSLPLVPSRAASGMIGLGGGAGGGFRGRQRKTLQTELRSCVPLAPGASFEITPLTPRVSGVGKYEASWAVPLSHRVDVDGVRLAIGYVESNGQKRIAAQGRLLVLPNLGAPSEGSGLRAAISVAEGQKPSAGHPLRATLTLENGGAKAARVDRDWPRYTWVFFGHREHREAFVIASTKELAVDEKARALDDTPEFEKERRPAIEIEPGASVSITFDIVVPEAAAGRGWMIAAAYENLEGEATDGLDALGFFYGRVQSKRLTVHLPE